MCKLPESGARSTAAGELLSATKDLMLREKRGHVGK